jgi:hypothetical protein
MAGPSLPIRQTLTTNAGRTRTNWRRGSLGKLGRLAGISLRRHLKTRGPRLETASVHYGARLLGQLERKPSDKVDC